MTDLWFIRIESILLILILILKVPMSKRVSIAWAAYFYLRWTKKFRRQSQRRWLWLMAVRMANGIEYDSTHGRAKRQDETH